MLVLRFAPTVKDRSWEVRNGVETIAEVELGSDGSCRCSALRKLTLDEMISVVSFMHDAEPKAA